MNQDFQKKIYLIRHGETEWSRSKQHTGRTDLPLTHKGEGEARLLETALEDIEFTKVYTSPLKRVLKTCQLAGFLSQAEKTDDLLEWDYGQYEGLTTNQIRKQSPQWNLFKDGAPSGESPEQIAHRADSILMKISNLNGNIAFFGSGHILRVVAARWIEQKPQHAQFLSLTTSSISVLSFEHEWKVILNWNETSHLRR